MAAWALDLTSLLFLDVPQLLYTTTEPSLSSSLNRTTLEEILPDGKRAVESVTASGTLIAGVDWASLNHLRN